MISAVFFRRHDGRDTGDAQHIALFRRARFDQRKRLCRQSDCGGSRGGSGGCGFGGHIDYVRRALCVKMGERRFFHGLLGALVLYIRFKVGFILLDGL